LEDAMKRGLLSTLWARRATTPNGVERALVSFAGERRDHWMSGRR
jgi:hypothetical protein